MMGKKLTHDEFLNKLETNNKYAFDNLEFTGEYKNSVTKILAKCKYGEILISPNCLLSGQNWNISSAVDKNKYFANYMKIKHKSPFDYSLVEYKNANSKINVICPIHSIFITTPHLHIDKLTCPQCSLDNRGMKDRLHHDDFVNMVDNKYPNTLKILKIIGRYKKRTNKILCKDKYGIVLIDPSFLLSKEYSENILLSIHKKSYFVSQAIEIHNNKYNYEDSVYIDKYTKIKIFCNKCEKYFHQTPFLHFTNGGCNCYHKKDYIRTFNGRKPFYTTKDIEDIINERNLNYKLLSNEYKNNKEKLLFLCNDCGNEFKRSLGCIVAKRYCPHCAHKRKSEIISNLFRVDYDNFISRFKKSQPYLYNEILSIRDYVNLSTRCIVETKYGDCKIFPSQLLIGCVPSIRTALDKTKYFIKKAKAVHNNKYDYSFVKYNGHHSKIIIVCPIHNHIFIQSCANHLSGNECRFCANEKSGWTLTNWLYSDAKYFDSYKLYKIEMWNKEENFYKIGITRNTIKRRFNCNLPYKYKVIDVIESDDGKYIWNLEKKLHRDLKEFRYKPLHSFGGETECFSKILI